MYSYSPCQHLSYLSWSISKFTDGIHPFLCRQLIQWVRRWWCDVKDKCNDLTSVSLLSKSSTYPQFKHPNCTIKFPILLFPSTADPPECALHPLELMGRHLGKETLFRGNFAGSSAKPETPIIVVIYQP